MDFDSLKCLFRLWYGFAVAGMIGFVYLAYRIIAWAIN